MRHPLMCCIECERRLAEGEVCPVCTLACSSCSKPADGPACPGCDGEFCEDCRHEHADTGCARQGWRELAKWQEPEE